MTKEHLPRITTQSVKPSSSQDAGTANLH